MPYQVNHATTPVVGVDISVCNNNTCSSTKLLQSPSQTMWQQYLLPMCWRIFRCSGQHKCFIGICTLLPLTTIGRMLIWRLDNRRWLIIVVGKYFRAAEFNIEPESKPMKWSWKKKRKWKKRKEKKRVLMKVYTTMTKNQSAKPWRKNKRNVNNYFARQ